MQKETIESIAKKFLEKSDLSQLAFSRALKKNHIYINAILKGRRKASAKLAKIIEKESGGAIPAKTLRPDIFG